MRLIARLATTHEPAPELHWMTLTSQGWKRSETAFYGRRPSTPRTLAPSQGIVFGVSPVNTPCRIAIIYSDGRSTNGFWRILPRWIIGRLPWLRDPHTLESPCQFEWTRCRVGHTPSPRGRKTATGYSTCSAAKF